MTALAAGVVPGLSAHAAQTIYPSKDGTLADGGGYGPFDGIADDWDWTFNDAGSGYEGAITLNVEERSGSLEHRLVWEYDLSPVTLTSPVAATLTFTIRTPAAWPRDDFPVHVYSYPADLQETAEDFHLGPAILEGSVTVAAWAPPDPPPVVQHSIDVSSVVSQALASAENKVAFRFQVAPDTPADVNQAFIDAMDSDPATKPFLTVEEAAPVPGDGDGDGDVDLDDFAAFALCVSGPDVPFEIECEVFNLDQDVDVDLTDFALFQYFFTD
jgi:hypothetical protein